MGEFDGRVDNVGLLRRDRQTNFSFVLFGKALLELSPRLSPVRGFVNAALRTAVLRFSGGNLYPSEVLAVGHLDLLQAESGAAAVCHASRPDLMPGGVAVVDRLDLSGLGIEMDDDELAGDVVVGGKSHRVIVLRHDEHGHKKTKVSVIPKCPHRGGISRNPRNLGASNI